MSGNIPPVSQQRNHYYSAAANFRRVSGRGISVIMTAPSGRDPDPSFHSNVRRRGLTTRSHPDSTPHPLVWGGHCRPPQLMRRARDIMFRATRAFFFFPFSGQDDAKFKRKLKIGKSRYTNKTIPRDLPTEGKGDYFARSKREKKNTPMGNEISRSE